jgi:hypothetical protein
MAALKEESDALNIYKSGLCKSSLKSISKELGMSVGGVSDLWFVSNDYVKGIKTLLEVVFG